MCLYTETEVHPQGQSILVQTLPFGLKTTPWVFTRVVTQVKTMQEVKDISIHFYLDDWIVSVDFH